MTTNRLSLIAPTWTRFLTCALLATASQRTVAAVINDPPVPWPSQARAVATRLAKPLRIDGDLRDWPCSTFRIPLNHAHSQRLDQRAAQVGWAWDDQALYLSLRALDTHRVSFKGAQPTWPLEACDGLELRLDTRSGAALGRPDWSEGTLRLALAPFPKGRTEPVWIVHPIDRFEQVQLRGVECAVVTHDWGYELEFKLPWVNLAGFQPRVGSLIGLEVVLVSCDSASRSQRAFALGSSANERGTPDTLGVVLLVEELDPDRFDQIGSVAFPLTVRTFDQDEERHHSEVEAVVGIPPSWGLLIAEVEVRQHAADGSIAGVTPARLESFGPEGLEFRRAVARWSETREAAVKNSTVTARLVSPTGKTIATIAPQRRDDAH